MKIRHLLVTLFVFFAACTQVEEAPSFLVSLVTDGRELTFEYTVPVTVAEFLQDAEVEIGELDRVEPPAFSQIRDGMRVTVVRVEEQTECEEEEIPHRTNRVFNEGLAPGDELLGQAGLNGVEEICYRVLIEDGIRRDPVEISRVILTEAQDEVVYIGPTGQLDPVPITGTLAYINNRNAWIMSGSSTTKRPLTTASDLDNRVFSLSENGRQLIFTTRDNRDNDRETYLNQLWMISDTGRDADPIKLIPEDILAAEWIPGQSNMISYTTGEARQTAPGWQAFNDLWTMRIDPQTGEALNINEVLEPSSGGLYGWWGTAYKWSPDGTQLGWVRADSLGTVDLDSGELRPLLQFPLFNAPGDWSWRASLSWSPDNQLLLTQVHGPPVSNEPAEFSPVFNVAVTSAEGSFSTEVVDNAGIWSSPTYSPLFTPPDSEFSIGRFVYLQARDISNSINPQAEYDLIVADRDGSNQRRIFPPVGQPGLTAQQTLAWSPDARQIAFIYQGNLWVADVETGVTHQLTLDGGASHPVWTL